MMIKNNFLFFIQQKQQFFEKVTFSTGSFGVRGMKLPKVVAHGA